ncbi:MAG: ATP-grasp domain-containing protein [Leptospiraceae bacterium]|nr:ATP-grasp domain-containing protein [Leptospiraceae bacterium]
MSKKGYIISLGAGKNQVPFLEKISEMGYGIIAVDINPNAIGFGLAEIRIQNSILEPEKIYLLLLKTVLDAPIVGVGLRSFGKAVKTAAFLAEKFRVTHPKLEIIEKFQNKFQLKKELEQNKILIPKQFHWKNISERTKITKELTFPLIQKPIDGDGKKGIKIFHSLSEWKKSNEKNKSGYAEEYIQGKEITVLGFVQGKKFHLVSISDKITTESPPFLEKTHIVPSTSRELAGEVILICNEIIKATGLDDSPFVAEFKVNQRGDIYLIECVPEIGGEFLADALIPNQFKYDYFFNYVKLILGKKISRPKIDWKPKTYSVLNFIIPNQPKTRFIGLKKSKKEVKPFFSVELQKTGASISFDMGNLCRVYASAFDVNALDLEIDKEIIDKEAIFEELDENELESSLY